VDLPKAILAQVSLGFVTAFVFAIAISYGIQDLDAIIANNGAFPLGDVYAQATNSRAATVGLLLIVFLSVLICAIGTVLMVGRLWWTLARDNATPFSPHFSQVNERLSCPVPATILCSVLTTAFGAIQLGSKTAFTILVGSFITLTSMSYLCAIAANILTRRENIPKGPFSLGRAGYVVNVVTCVLIAFFNVCSRAPSPSPFSFSCAHSCLQVWFCWPFAKPVTVEGMNYNSVILAGVVVLTELWWELHGRRQYPGPKLAELYLGDK
jgi:amino acid transporter